MNSFFGFEIPRDLPPTCAPIGPLLNDTYPPLDDECGKFLSERSSVVYIALGTHIILANSDASKIIQGLALLYKEGLIDGIIWSIGKSGRQDLDLQTVLEWGCSSSRYVSLGDILASKAPSFLCSSFVPQRAILEHPSTRLYFTHGGGSSANEGLFHGKLMLSMGVFMDQIANTARLVDGGVAETLNKFGFTSMELYVKAKKLLLDKDKTYGRNSLRLMRIARIASKRKHYAADLIEEHMYDAELRFQDGKELRPMHLQTADMRMSKWKARNWDLWAVSFIGFGALGSSLAYSGHLLWVYRNECVKLVKDQVEAVFRR